MEGGGQTFTEPQNVCVKPLSSKKGRPLLVSGERGVFVHHQMSTKSLLSARQPLREGLVRPGWGQLSSRGKNHGEARNRTPGDSPAVCRGREVWQVEEDRDATQSPCKTASLQLGRAARPCPVRNDGLSVGTANCTSHFTYSSPQGDD